MSTGNGKNRFSLPSEVTTPPGAEGWEEMFPYFTRFRPGDDERFWFYNGMHFPEALSSFDAITVEAPLMALGAFNTRVFAIPAAKGIEHRIINGRVFLGGVPVFDPKEIQHRLTVFQDRAKHYYADWENLYDKWKTKMMALIQDTKAIPVPELPEFDDKEVVTEAKGISQNYYLFENYNQVLEGYFKMWQYHFEFLILGFGAYMTFFEFCKRAFPEIEDQNVARMAAGMDNLMYRGDDELKRLARLAVELNLDSLFPEGVTAQRILSSMKENGEAGAKWLAEFEISRDPWFNVSTGDGFYHHHVSWNDDLSIPFSALPGYVRKIRAGENVERPTEHLRSERTRLITEYRSLLPTEQDKRTFDQMVELTHRVFPYNEDHKFYCENWFSTMFFNKIREFGKLLAQHGLIPETEDVFQLTHREAGQALCDLALGWAAGSEAQGKHHWPAIIAKRKKIRAALTEWIAPPALGPVPDDIQDPFLLMLWGITSDQLKAWSEPPPAGGAKQLQGLPASAGIVEGIARVIRTVAEIPTLLEGEILVCPVTAPSWTPVFGKIAAAVSDIGGSMSHAAIVAREYGLPAVVGTGHATKIITTGQRIRVDGSSGIVTILS